MKTFLKIIQDGASMEIFYTRPILFIYLLDIDENKYN